MVSRRLLLFSSIIVLASSVVVAQSPPGRIVKSETLEIPATGEEIETALALQDGQFYLIEARGIFTYSGGNRVADAEWTYDPDVNAWSELGAGPEETIPINLDLLVNGAPVDWLGTEDGKHFTPHTFSQSHTYRLVLEGTGQPVSFKIYDVSFDGNEGTLLVTISKLKGRRP